MRECHGRPLGLPMFQGAVTGKRAQAKSAVLGRPGHYIYECSGHGGDLKLPCQCSYQIHRMECPAIRVERSMLQDVVRFHHPVSKG